MKKLILLMLVGCSAPPGPRLVVLGIAQDGGVPHLGCTQPPCSEGRREKVACLGLTDGTRTYLFDATPDMPAQLRALNGGRAPDGIFLTHAHIGHYTGLMYLGKETLAARGVPVYVTPRMADLLRANGPWSLLVKDGHIDLRNNAAVELPGGFRVTAIPVPHREEFTDTVGYLIEGPRRKALFIPDIDKWEKWDRSLAEFDVDYAFLDGTFSSAAEIPRAKEVPHPLMDETRQRLRGSRVKLWFIHLNHTNPALLDGDDVAREGMEFEM